MRIVVLLLSLLVAAMGAAAILAPEGLLPITVLSLGREAATLKSCGSDPGFA